MKKFLALLLVSSVLFLGLLALSRQTLFSSKARSEEAVLGLPVEKTVDDELIEYGGQKISYSFWQVDDGSEISLYVNSNLKLTSTEAVDKYSCRLVTSGGYYKTDSSPTGLLISNYSQVSPLVKSSLSNAFFSVNDLATPRITTIVPTDRLRLALQAGPLLLENGAYKKLKLVRDEQAKRLVLGVTGDNKAVFIVFYDSKSSYLGPWLADLPEVLKLFSEKTGVELADAMNLDGGTASAFVSEEVNLPEATFMGSFFCVK